jgi:hypothetical protein
MWIQKNTKDNPADGPSRWGIKTMVKKVGTSPESAAKKEGAKSSNKWEPSKPHSASSY